MKKSKSDNAMESTHVFTSAELSERLQAVENRTLGDVDSNGLFESATKNKGIAGHIIEQSVLGYSINSRPEHDIEVDGIGTEVKTPP